MERHNQRHTEYIEKAKNEQWQIRTLIPVRSVLIAFFQYVLFSIVV